MSPTSSQIAGRMSTHKRIAFYVIVAVVGIVFPLVLLEIGLRVAGFQIPQDPFLSFGTVPEFFMKKNVNGTLYYQVIHRDVYSERETAFTAKKSPKTLCVICLGASASAGWPHQGGEIYSAYLQEALQRAYPDRRIEVLNLSAHAYAAYRVRLIFEEALQFEPDVFVIWSGNNEFLEKRVYRTGESWVEPLASAAKHSLLYRGVRGSRVGRWLFPDNTLSAHERGHHLYTMWSKLEQVAVALRTDPEQFEAVKHHYASSIESMVEMAESRGIPVVLATVPVNLREWTPAVSCHSVQGAELTHWETRYHHGRRALIGGDYRTAVEELTAAVAVDPQYAEGYFYLGRAYEGLRSLDLAYENYVLARDYDCNPFRAISAFGDTVRNIAARHANVTVADLVEAFRGATAPYAPGFDLFLDHVHPTKRGNLVAAETVFAVMLRARLFPSPESAPAFVYQPKPVPGTSLPYDDWTDAPMQALLVRFYMAQHQDASIVARSQYLLDTPALKEQLPDKDLEFLQMAKNLFSQIIASEQRWMAGEAPDPREQNRAKLLEFYKATFEGYQEYRAKYGKAVSS